MKLRLKFVSNSSSSSFLIFVRDTSIIEEINEGIGPNTGWFNDTLMKEVTSTEYYDNHGDFLNIPKEIIEDESLRAFEGDFEQNHDNRWNLLKDPRVILLEYIGGC